MSPSLSKYIVLAIMIVTAFPMPILGDELKLIPSLALKEEFNDNILLATNSRLVDFVTVLTPSLDLSSANERRNLGLSSGINWLNYARNAGLDSVDYFVRSGFNYQLDPRLSISVAANYVRDSRPDRVDLNGLPLKSGSDRQNYQLSGTYAVSEKSNSSVSYAYSHEAFDDPGLLSSTVHTATIVQDYDLDRYLRQAKLVGNFGFFRMLTDISHNDNYTLSLGLTKRIHELWNVSLNAGGSFTHSEFDATTFKPPAQSVSSTMRSDDLGWIGNLSVDYNGEKTNGSLVFKHEVTPASGRTGVTQTTGVSTNLIERFTRELSGHFAMGYYWNKADQNQLAAQSIDDKYLTLNGGLSYELSDFVTLEGNYGFTNIDHRNSAGKASQNVFQLRLTMRRDLMDL